MGIVFGAKRGGDYNPAQNRAIIQSPMPEIESIQAQRGEMAEWRRDFHRHPELLYDVHRTAGIVAAKLRAFGCDEVAEGIGQTGVVGIIQGKAEGPTVGLRADMDALPIRERNDFAHKSTIEGKMHACGHDGHTAMLLGAARYLAQTRDFAGRIAAIFQPAEEGGAGGLAMVKDGMMTRFAIERVFGMHNMPKMSAKSFGARAGACMAAADFFDIEIEGRGGHAAYPHDCVDPVAVGAQIVAAAQHLVSREVEAVDRVVISICEFHAGGRLQCDSANGGFARHGAFFCAKRRDRESNRAWRNCASKPLSPTAPSRACITNGCIPRPSTTRKRRASPRKSRREWRAKKMSNSERRRRWAARIFRLC